MAAPILWDNTWAGISVALRFKELVQHLTERC